MRKLRRLRARMLTMRTMILLVFSSSLSQWFVVGANFTTSIDYGYVNLDGISLCPDVSCAASNYSCLPKPWDYSYCKCDMNCKVYSDCCYDYAEICQATEGDRPTTDILTNKGCIPTKLNHYTNPLLNGEAQVTGYFMIDKCPRNYANRVIRDNCEQDESLNWMTSPPKTWSAYNGIIPASDSQSGSSYKNVYCAWCNGVAIENIQLWNLYPSCSWEDVSPRECGPVYVDDDFKGSLVTDLRSCIVVDETRCPPSADETTSRLCDSYYLPVTHHGRTYRNPHCAVCHEPSLKGSAVCSSEMIDDIAFITSSPLPQFLPFDFYSQADSDLDNSKPRCAAGFYYNSTIESCAPVTPEINMPERCLHVSNSMALLFYYHPRSNNVYDIKSSIAEHVGVDDTDVEQSDCGDDDEDCIRVDINLSYYMPFVNIDDLPEYVGSVIPLKRVVALYPCVAETSLNENRRCNDVTTMPLPFENASVYESDKVLILRDLTENRVYFIKGKLLQMSVTLSFIEDRNVTVLNFTLYLCEGSLTLELACPHFVLSKEDLRYYSDYIESTLETDEFLAVGDGSTQVCTLPEINLVYLWIIYVILSSLSIILLTAAFLIYCVFSFLRNGPGKLIMNFFVAVALSQLVLLVGATQSHSPIVCTTFAVVGHYTWLVVFLWISIIAFSVSNTFGGSMKSNRSKLSNKTLMVILVFGWGIPAIFVGTCVMVKYLDIFSFDYGNSKGCWIRPGRVNLLLFGLPSACCLIFNLVMFVRTSIGIRRSMEGAKRVHENKSQLFKDEVVIYIKVSILMGFCWVWAFLSGFFPASFALLILHTIFVPSQGILVFFIYVCNRRMMAKWRSIFSEVSSSERRSSKLTAVLSTGDGLTKTRT